MLASPFKVFLSYSAEDERWKNLLVTHLGVAEAEGRLELWNVREIPPGSDRRIEIVRAMNEADVAVLLISASFLTSDFIRTEEVPRLLERRKLEGMIVVPVIARACLWDEVKWLAGIEVLPSDRKPLARHRGERVNEEVTKIGKAILRIGERETWEEFVCRRIDRALAQVSTDDEGEVLAGCQLLATYSHPRALFAIPRLKELSESGSGRIIRQAAYTLEVLEALKTPET